MVVDHHHEAHFTSNEFVRDAAIGMADGLTVPFALAAGLSGAAASSHLVITAGLAEIAAGTVAMGLGGYLAARSDADHYASEHRREKIEIVEKPAAERAEVTAVFRRYGLNDAQIAPVLAAFEKDHGAWVDFMMQFELGLERPEPGRAAKAAGTIGGAYALGGLLPLAPYFFHADASRALPWSAAATLVSLLAFGWAKGRWTSGRPVQTALRTALVGGAAAGAAFALAKLVS
jgi:VIT1/CCC1 family predicted Fe2+/Mn2+ transporter